MGNKQDWKEEVVEIRSIDKESNYRNLIYICDPTEDLKTLIKKEEVIIKSNEAMLNIRYPLKQAFVFNIKSKNKNGFTRTEIVEIICDTYRKIYKEEDESLTGNVAEKTNGNVLNRETTDGKYGIWGHDIEDLLLDLIIIQTHKVFGTVINLAVES